MEAVELMICPVCGEEKAATDFYRDRNRKCGRRFNCKVCSTIASKKWALNNEERLSKLTKEYRSRPDVKLRRNKITKEWNRKNVDSILLTHARKRAKESGIECTITKKDIIVPEFCPALGIPLIVGEGHQHENSPTLDRINSSKGYTPDNIVVVSHKANRIKNNATLEEFERIYLWLKTVWN